MMNLKEAKQVLKNNGYYIVDNTLNESLDMNEVVGLIDDLEKQDAIITSEMVDVKVAELYMTRSQYDAITVFEEIKQLSKCKKRWYITKGIGEDDLKHLTTDAKRKVMPLIDSPIPVWKLTIEF